ncbi:MAG: hypothetical protein SGJ21_11675 [Alphaproteobacteria bacterium]|nr:hypothetical protein [Alphaproteobacteria bacterium]
MKRRDKGLQPIREGAFRLDALIPQQAAQELLLRLCCGEAEQQNP